MRAGSVFPPLSRFVSSPTLPVTGTGPRSHPHTDNGSAAHTFPCECVLYYRRSPHTPLHGSTLVGFFLSLLSLNIRTVIYAQKKLE